MEQSQNLKAIQYCTKVLQIPGPYAENFVLKLKAWKQENYPPLDPIKMLRRFGSKKPTTRKILIPQIFKVIKLSE